MGKKINSLQKGKAGERELARVLRGYGIEARRGAQYCGDQGDSDVLCAIPWMHIECKRTERLQLKDAYDQATRNSLGKKTPVVVHRSNRQPWMVSLSLEDFLKVTGVTHGQK